MHDTMPVPIYPSQLFAFKKLALFIAEHAAKHSGEPKLSAFKRNDCLARALGYKGHSDLVMATKFRAQADPFTRLTVLEDEALRLSVAEAFAAEAPNLGAPFFTRICEYRLDETTIWEQWGYRLRAIVLCAQANLVPNQARWVAAQLFSLEGALSVWQARLLPETANEGLETILLALPCTPLGTGELDGTINEKAASLYYWVVGSCTEILDDELGKKNPFSRKQAAH